jgi:transposase-like protein
MTTLEQPRQVRGLTIVAIGEQIKRINKLSYKVKSQSNGIWYSVEKKYGKTGKEKGIWTCACPDHSYRKVTCKHIYAVLFSKQLRKKLASHNVVGSLIELPNTELIQCQKCNSVNVVKNGSRQNQRGTTQRYKCKDCGYRFIIDYGFEKSRASAKAVTAALDLYFKGVSLRKVCDHLKQFYDIEVTHPAVLKWIRKFAKVVKPYVDQLIPPHLSGIYHVDEMMVHVRKEENAKGHYQWLWNLMDNTTRFWISSMITNSRYAIDARTVFQDAKKKTNDTLAIVHDGLQSYDKAFNKEYRTLKSPRVANIRSVSVRHEGLNSRVERLNGTMRDREKVMRGMDNAESAQQLIEAFRINYNFCREHRSLGKTPAEIAGINVQLGDNKLLDLIRSACKNKE